MRSTRMAWLTAALVISSSIFAVTFGCSASSKDGVSISVVLEGPSAPPLVGESRIIESDLGYRVVVRRGYMSTGTVEVLACTAPTSWRSLFLREAHAHTTGSPTLLGVPAVESLLAPAEMRLVVGELHPPAGSYCRVRQTIRPADDDAVGLSPDVPMTDKSLLIEGSYARAGEAPTDFAVSSTRSIDVETSVEAAALSASGARVVELVLSKTGDHWFDAIDFASSSDDDRSTRLLENLRRSLGARFQ